MCFTQYFNFSRILVRFSKLKKCGCAESNNNEFKLQSKQKFATSPETEKLGISIYTFYYFNVIKQIARQIEYKFAFASRNRFNIYMLPLQLRLIKSCNS